MIIISNDMFRFRTFSKKRFFSAHFKRNYAAFLKHNYQYENRCRRKRDNIYNRDAKINNRAIITRCKKNNFYFFNLFNVFISTLILAPINSETIKM